MRADDSERLRASLAARWWALLLRGALSVLFGVAMLVWPDVSLLVLVIFVGAWFFADGLLALALAFTHGHRLFHILDGAVGVMIGSVAMLHPNVNGLTLLVIVAVWAIARGVLQMLLAMDLGSRRRGSWFFAAIGAVSPVRRVVASNPGPALAVVVAGFAVLLGLAYISTGLARASNGAGLPLELPRAENRMSSRGPSLFSESVERAPSSRAVSVLTAESNAEPSTGLRRYARTPAAKHISRTPGSSCAVTMITGRNRLGQTMRR
jgi:uncharacterized membrane protein HdeD (DUF308 family)